VATKDDTVAFQPNPLSDEQAATTSLKRALFGAGFVGHITQLLGGSMIQIVWEVDLVLDPPPYIRPTRPKAWLMGKLTLDQGKYYKAG
jgi:hypothetical protein